MKLNFNNIKYKTVKKILLLVLVSSVLLYVSILIDSESLKYISTFAQLFVIVISLNVIYKHRNFIRWTTAVPILFVLSIYPLIRIISGIFEVGNFKAFTDGLIIYGGYYQLVFIGFALALLTKKINAIYLLEQFSKYLLIVGIVLIILTLNFTENYAFIGFGRSAITNCFIPISLLAISSTKKSKLLVGWISMITVIIISLLIYSRSFTLIGVLLISFTVYYTFKLRKIKLIILIIIISLAFYIFGIFTYLDQSSFVQGQSTIDKFQVESLVDSIKKFFQTWDFNYIFYWKGNSRASILLAAFDNFKFSNWIWGKGIFATYKSFMERSTIEVGFAQEIFRFGLPYVLMTIAIAIRGYFALRNKSRNFDALARMLGTIIIIRLIDGLIYGVPQTSVYNLIYFWGVMMQINFNKQFSKPVNKIINKESFIENEPNVLSS